MGLVVQATFRIPARRGSYRVRADRSRGRFSSMWAWRKKNRDDRLTRGAARAALNGEPRENLARETLNTLSREIHADRIGVWLQQDASPVPEPPPPEVLRGLIWDSSEEQTPGEWEKLSLDLALPRDLLLSGKSVEQLLDGGAARPVLGPLIGLHQALWTPIQSKDRLYGVLLTGWQSEQPSLPRQRIESAAAELALVLELQEVRRLARECQSDLRLQQEMLAALANGSSTDTVLSQLAASCAALAAEGGDTTAAFAAIGHSRGLPANAPAPEMEFSWESGSPAWSGAGEREPLASLWRGALESGRVTGAEYPAPAPGGVTRLVAIPLDQADQHLGVLVAGIPQKASSLHTLERLERRAALAAAALESRRSSAERIHRAARRQAQLEFSPEPTVFLDLRGNIASFNRAAKTLFDGTPDERAHQQASLKNQQRRDDSPWYSGAHFATLFCAREQACVEEWCRCALAAEREKLSEAPAPLEAELIGGARVRLRSPIATGDDLAAVVLDPAAAPEAVTLRSRSETELYNVLEWVEEGILLFGTNDSIRAMNTRFAQIAGLSAEEAASCGTMESLLNELARRVAEPEVFARRWRELARGSEGAREEIPLARPVPRVLERSVRPVLDSMGRRLGRVEIYRDLTAQRVFQAKLLQTEKLAALGQMITGVAHELSNPLTSILGYSQRLLVRNDLAGRTQEARQIYQEAERASAILRQLLLTAREKQPERKRVALNQIVQKAMELQRFGSASEKIRIELDLDAALPFVLGDAGQLQQVVMNLVGNARQALVQEGKAGTIRLRTAQVGAHRVQMQVIDDGPGIPQAILARIFDPFFTTKPAGVGTGLGLSIVLSIVREHGGQVHVTSPPGGGATFTVELPVAAEASLESASRANVSRERRLSAVPLMASHKNGRPASVPAADHSGHRGARVLVVEDEPTVARLIADVLEDGGMHVDVLFDGREALERATRNAYDLVICDMKMPGIDGQHFFRSLADARSPLLDRFLFVTGDVLAPQTQEFLECNHVPHVAKPFRVEELTERVYSLLNGERARAGRAAAARKAQ